VGKPGGTRWLMTSTLPWQETLRCTRVDPGGPVIAIWEKTRQIPCRLRPPAGPADSQQDCKGKRPELAILRPHCQTKNI
jgi:hypothetical protein